jgi:hypothetical protein
MGASDIEVSELAAKVSSNCRLCVRETLDLQKWLSLGPFHQRELFLRCNVDALTHCCVSFAVKPQATEPLRFSCA